MFKARKRPSTTDAGASNAAFSQEHFIWLLGSFCRIHGVRFDPQLLLHHFPPPYTLDTLRRAAHAMGFTTDECVYDVLDTHDLPCMGILLADQAADADLQDNHQTNGKKSDNIPQFYPVLIASLDKDRALYFSAGTDQPQTEERTAFLKSVAQQCLVLRPNAAKFSSDELDAQSNRFGLKWFIPELLKYKKIWRDILLASFAIQVIGLATPLFTQVVIDKVIVHHTLNTLVVIAFALFMFMIFGAIMTWVRQYLVLHTGNRLDAVLGARVFKHLFELPLRYFQNRPTGTLVARLQGVETIRQFIAGAAVTLMLDIPFLIVFVSVMFYYSWQLTLIVVGILGAISILSMLVTPILRKRLNEQFQFGARSHAFLTEYISGVETVKSLQMEPQLDKRYGGLIASYLSAGFRTRSLSNTYNVAANGLEQFQVLAILGVGAWYVMTTDGFTIGMLVAFQMFANRLSQPVLRLVGLWLEFQQTNVAIKRLGDILDAPAEPYSVIPSRSPGGSGRIEIRDISFRYDDSHPYLYQGLNLVVEPGSSVAVMGPSGSGKSTLTKLLQGFYQPTDGCILIDGRDIRHLSANELRQYFGVVPQETMLFSGTIYENLVMANPRAGFEQIIQACKLADIHEVIEKLPKAYETEIGEHGAGLSGGQKQRLAIARALLKQPKILIFDEATSNLDRESSWHVAAAINRIKGHVTIIFVAHQIPDNLKLTKIFRLDKEAEGVQQSKSQSGSVYG